MEFLSPTARRMTSFFPRTPARQPNFNTPPAGPRSPAPPAAPRSQTLTNPAMEAAEAVQAEAIMVSADTQRMAPLTPIDAAQTIVAPSAAINASNWLQKFFVNRKILDSDYCVE